VKFISTEERQHLMDLVTELYQEVKQAARSVLLACDLSAPINK